MIREIKRCPTCGQPVREKCAECGKPFDEWPVNRQRDPRSIYCSPTCRSRATVRAFRQKQRTKRRQSANA